MVPAAVSSLNLVSNPEGVYAVFVNVYHGDITKDYSNIIVNGCNSRFELNSGTLSKAICREAGSELQRQCRENPTMQSPDYRVTPGFKLPSKLVVHLALSALDAFPDRIRDAVECAEKLCATSLAFPALGTGRLGWSVRDVALCFRKVFLGIGRDKATCLRAINLVIFQKSNLDCFEKIILFDQRFPLFADQRLQSALTKTWSSETPRAFTIYTDSEERAEEACTALRLELENVLTEEELPEEFFSNFTYHESADFCLKAASHSVNVFIQGTGVKLRGYKDNVTTLCSNMLSVAPLLKNAALLTSHVAWKWSVDDVNFRDFPHIVSSFIERAFEEGRAWLYVPFYGEQVLINFFKMTYESAAEDLMQGSGSIRRFSGASELPHEWSDMEGKPFLKVKLPPHAAEYKTVSSKFFAGLRKSASCVITKIERIQNPTLYQQYMIGRQDVVRYLTSDIPVERELFHGTSEVDADKICAHGFDRGFAGKNATAFGHGVYFAVRSSYSQVYSTPNPQNISVMFLARVLTGDFCQGHPALKVPPPKTNCDHGRLYDSVVNKPSDPTIFVVFKDSSVYPSYLISFKRNR